MNLSLRYPSGTSQSGGTCIRVQVERTRESGVKQGEISVNGRAEYVGATIPRPIRRKAYGLWSEGHRHIAGIDRRIRCVGTFNGVTATGTPLCFSLIPARVSHASTRLLTKGVYPRRFQDAMLRRTREGSGQNRRAPRCERLDWISRRRDGRTIEREREKEKRRARRSRNYTRAAQFPEALWRPDVERAVLGAASHAYRPPTSLIGAPPLPRMQDGGGRSRNGAARSRRSTGSRLSRYNRIGNDDDK